MKLFKYFILIVAVSGCMNRNSPEKTGLEGKPLPEFNVILMDSVTNFNTKDIPADKPVVVYLFSPICPYCKVQTKELIDNISSLKGIRFYMLSSFPFEWVKKYCVDYQLDKYTNITVALDTTLYYKNYIKAVGMPYIAIYGKDKHLRKTWLGRVSVNMIKDVALE